MDASNIKVIPLVIRDGAVADAIARAASGNFDADALVKALTGGKSSGPDLSAVANTLREIADSLDPK